MADLLTNIRADIGARMRELEPAITEFERLKTAAEALVKEGSTASTSAKRATSPPSRRSSVRSSASAREATAKKATPVKPVRRARKREQPTHTPNGQAILAALEHGSHTQAELVVVTALRASDVRKALGRLRARKAIVKTDRDGKAAYALPSAAAG